nr:MAG TPA: hypothetical protein [Caudoviricetes sp.]
MRCCIYGILVLDNGFHFRSFCNCISYSYSNNK